jgi:hypothetical protein
MFTDPGAAEWILGALLVLRLAEFRRIGATPPAHAIFHGLWLAVLVVLAIGHGAVETPWAVAAIALMGLRAARMLRGARTLPIAATFAELLVLPLAFGIWPLALAGAALYALLLRFAGE